MADKNLARSGAADADLLSDDDPLAELARIVGYEPRNVPTAARPVPPEPLRDPVIDLEDELLREFAQYDAPALDPVDHVAASEIAPASALDEDVLPHGRDPFQPAAEPVADGTASQEPEVPAAFALEPDWNAPSQPGHAAAAAADHFDPGRVEQSSAMADDTRSPAGEQPSSAEALPAMDAPEALPTEPVFLGLQPAEFAVSAPESASLDLDLDRELELSLGETLTEATEGPLVEAALPTVATPSASAPDLSFDADAAGLAIADTGNAHAGEHQESLIETLPRVELPPGGAAELAWPSAFDEPVPVTRSLGEGGHFEAAGLPAEVASVMFSQDERQAADPDSTGTEATAFQPTATYDVAPAEPSSDGFDLDELLAEVERYPVPEPRPQVQPSVEPMPEPMAAVLPAAVVEPAQAPRTRPGSLDGFSSVKFGRATPVAPDRQKEPVVPAIAAQDRIEPAMSVQADLPAEPAAAIVPATTATSAPIPEQPAAPEADDAVSDVEDAFANFELDLSDIELDPTELKIEPTEAEAPVAPPPAPVFTQPAAVEAAASQPVAVESAGSRAASQPVVPAAEPAPRVAEPAFAAEPVAASAQAPEPEEFDVALPFDPSLIAETDVSVAPVAELDVPQFPVADKEKVADQQPEYDFDIDAEMAQLFTRPVAGYARSDRSDGPAEASGSTDAPGEADEFDKALEEDLRRSLSQSERHAIPLDAQQADDDYVGDGYDEPSRRGRTLKFAAAAAVLVALGGAGAYAFLSGAGSDGAGAGEPRVILADKDPVKIVPEQRGGKTVPNQDKAVYDRVAGANDVVPQQEQLVTATEEPVDVVQRTLTPESLPFEAPEDEAPAIDAASAGQADDRLLPGVDDDPAVETSVADNQAPVVSARKVRTMIVKPDGTLVAREDPVVEPESAMASPASSSEANSDAGVDGAAPALAAPTDTAGEANVALRSATADTAASEPDDGSAALKEVADASVEQLAPVRPVKTTAVDAEASEAATDVASAAAPTGTPVPVTRPVDQPVDVVGTVTERGRVADTAPTETAALAQPAAEQAPAAVANPGGYVIQIASLPSEADAQKSYSNLSSRFSSVIGGRGVDIQRADIPNKGTYYRVRIPAGSREEANALCAQYKSAGGSCLVTK